VAALPFFPFRLGSREPPLWMKYTISSEPLSTAWTSSPPYLSGQLIEGGARVDKKSSVPRSAGRWLG
jgi:hypothetical protein